MMELQVLFDNTSLKNKELTAQIAELVSQNKIELSKLISFAKESKDPIKATCIEAMEFATKKDSSKGTSAMMKFAIESLKEKAPRIKWESAKVIGNIATHFPKQLDDAVAALLKNTEHKGTVVRWSAAFALGEILKLKRSMNKDLIPAIENITSWETNNAIRKIYMTALKIVSNK